MSFTIRGNFNLTGQVKGVSSVFGPNGTALFTINNPDSLTNGYFGQSIALFDDYMAVGSMGAVYIYNKGTGNLLRTISSPSSNDDFGYSVSIEGTTLVVGAPSDDAAASNSGKAYVYNVLDGSLIRTIHNPAPEFGDWFGYSVAISGNNIAVGAGGNTVNGSSIGTIYIYNASTGALQHTINNPDNTTSWFGYSLDMDNNHVVVGAPDLPSGAGKAYLFDVLSGSLIYELTNPTPASNENFGNSISVHGDYLVVGAVNEGATVAGGGAAYVYDVNNGNLLYTLVNPINNLNDYYGYRVAVYGDQIAVSAWMSDNSDNIDAGSVYVYDVVNGAPLYSISSIMSDERFGGGLAIDGGVLAVGAPYSSTSNPNAGTIYTYI